jgi:hypothetical protein
MKKLFLDTEFTGLHKNTTLISLGIVSECGKTFYAEFNDYDESQVDDWIRDNVIKNLLMSAPNLDEDEYYMASRHHDNPIGNDLEASYSVHLRGNRRKIKSALKNWLNQFDKVEIWSDCLAYDWVLFCDIFRNPNSTFKDAFGFPRNVYYIPFDLSTAFRMTGIDPDISREEFAEMTLESKKHNALWDAQVIKACFQKLLIP